MNAFIKTLWGGREEKRIAVASFTPRHKNSYIKADV